MRLTTLENDRTIQLNLEEWIVQQVCEELHNRRKCEDCSSCPYSSGATDKALDNIKILIDMDLIVFDADFGE